MTPKLYLAGPEVFLPNPALYADKQRELCQQYGFTAIHPLDNNLDLTGHGYDVAVKIYRGDINQIHEADIVVANCNPFRGVCVDDGTAYELGFANALGKPSYGYMTDEETLLKRTIATYPCKPWSGDSKLYIDTEGYLVVDDFTTRINLMLEVGMTDNHGSLISGSFEACLQTIQADIKSGELSLA